MSVLTGNKILAVVAVLLVGLLGFSVISEKIPPIPPGSDYGGRIRIIDYITPKYAAVDSEVRVSSIVSDVWFQSKPETTISVVITPLGSVVCVPQGLPGAPSITFPMDTAAITLAPAAKKIWTSSQVDVQAYAEQWLSRTQFTNFDCSQNFQLVFEGGVSEQVTVRFSFSMRADDIRCTDTDGLDYWTQGNIVILNDGLEVDRKVDYCADATNVAEYKCAGISYAIEQHACLLGCNSASNACRTYSCVDPDRASLGDGFFTKTTVVSKKDEVTRITETTATDYCLTETRLREYGCGVSGVPQGQIGYLDGNCGIKCMDGACMTESCTDTDGGKNFFAYGTVTLMVSGGGGVPIVYPDRCEGNTIVEYWCPYPNEGSFRTVETPCPCGCQNGACNTIGSATCIAWGGGTPAPPAPPAPAPPAPAPPAPALP